MKSEEAIKQVQSEETEDGIMENERIIDDKRIRSERNRGEIQRQDQEIIIQSSRGTLHQLSK